MSTAEAQSVSIDENQYSRQLYVLGKDAMQRMAQSNVLIVGLGGLGVEIAKNVILIGVKSVTLHDDDVVSWNDLSSQFYVTENDIGVNRVDACINRLADLNQYVPVTAHKGELTLETYSKFNVVVFTERNICDLVELNSALHNKVKFIAAETRGVSGRIFVDFGEQFVVTDQNGEEPLQSIVVNVTKDNPATVSVHDEHRHGLSDGDLVQFADIEGMSELNTLQPVPIKSTGHYTFTIDVDTTGFSDFIRGGYVKQVKPPRTMDFLPLGESIKKPTILDTDFFKLDQYNHLHAAFDALHAFQKQNNRVPKPYNVDDANQLVSLAKDIAKKNYDLDVDEEYVKKFAFTCAGNLNPIVAFIGGLAAQEVQKACSGKFTPFNQWYYYDAVEALPSEPISEADAQPLNCRYDGQIAVFGKQINEKLTNLKYFIVGAGALGCEFLKNFAMMGIGCGEKGKVYVTDMDLIEISNLNRQFLFRKKHVGQSKSTCAAAAAKEMNPRMNIEALTEKVAPETEHIFDDEFWSSLDGVTNALDNVQARLYVDSRCVYYRKPLLESGTLGTKGNVQVVVPFVTESYGSSRDPPESKIPICTLKNFPNAIEHTIQWARDLFEGVFKQNVEDVNSYLSRADFIEQLDKQPGSKRGILENVHAMLVSAKPLTFDECIVWARLRFEQLFNNMIRQLLFNFPKDSVTSSGAPFWSGPKRPPTEIVFDENDPLHLDFIISAANLHAANYGLSGETNPEYFKRVLANVIVPEFTPKSGVTISTGEEEKKDDGASSSAQTSLEQDDEVCEQLIKELPAPSSLAGYRLNPLEFEKDDDTNFHMDFITAASNLRARNYKIAEADKHKTKGIAGKIIPAMITTTALITGLVCVEIYKLILNKPIEAYRNAFVNIALPLVTFSEPVPPATSQYYETKWSLWDRIDVDLGRDVTLKEFLDYFKNELKLEITMMSSGTAMIYSFFGNKKRNEERMSQTVSSVVSTIAKTDFLPKQNYINFEVCTMDNEGEDVDVPYVHYKFRGF